MTTQTPTAPASEAKQSAAEWKLLSDMGCDCGYQDHEVAQYPICAALEVCDCLDCYLMDRTVCAKCHHDDRCHTPNRADPGP